MNHAELESQTVVAFMEWRADPSVSLEMRCKDGSDDWGTCVLKDDCWWHHSYYRLKPAASVPTEPPFTPTRIAALIPKRTTTQKKLTEAHSK